MGCDTLRAIPIRRENFHASHDDFLALLLFNFGVPILAFIMAKILSSVSVPPLKNSSPLFSQCLRAVVLGGCVVLTISAPGFAPSLQAAPSGKVAVMVTKPVASPTATVAKPQNAPQSRIAVKVPVHAPVAPGVISLPVISVAAGSSARAAQMEEVDAEDSNAGYLDSEVSEDSELRPLTRLAVAGAGAAGGNTPAAAPPEEEPRIEVPIEDDEGDDDEPELPEVPGDEVDPPDPVITTNPANPAPAVEGNALAPAEAEGREVVTVRVVGNRAVDEAPILLAANFRPGAAYSTRQAELAVRSINALGFFAAVEQQVVPNLQDPTKVDVIFVVIENRIVTGFRIEGNKIVSSKDIIETITSKTGAVLRSTVVDTDVKKIQALYSERGYAALVTDVRQEDDGTVVFTVQEGVISRIELDGLKKTDEGIVRKNITSKPGDPFNERKIQRDLNRIFDTGFFEDVTYKVADDPEAPGSLIVTVSLKEKRTGQISFGAGFDSRSKISGFAGLSDINFRGTGKNVSAQVELGSQRSFDLGFGDRFVGSKNASYFINAYSRRTFRDPQTVEKVLGGGGGGGDDDDETFNYQEERTGIRVNFTQPIDYERVQSYLVGYRNESVKLSLINNNDGIPDDLPVNSSGRISAFSVGFLRDARDIRIDASTGERILFTVEQAVPFLGDTSFTKLDLNLSKYIPLIGAEKRGERPKLVLAGRVVVGQALGQLPAFEQYFVGGSQTVRGYDADRQFGDNQVYGNLELRYRFQRKLQFVAFADGGSAYGGRFSSSDSFSALFGVGVGVRLQTPIGPVSLDIARGSDGMKTHFGIQNNF